MLKRILLILVGAILVAVGIGTYEWFKPKTNYANATPDVTITADSLFNAFSKNEKHADSLYLNKVILVTGNIGQVTENQNKEKVIILESSDPIYGVSCTMYKSDSIQVNKLKSGDKAV